MDQLAISAILLVIWLVTGAFALLKQRELAATRKEFLALARKHKELETNLKGALVADTSKSNTLEDLRRELEDLRSELAKRPKSTRKTYRIMTLGIKATGKTSLTLKWANPLTDLGKIPGTKSDRYERTVSLQQSADATIQHVFEVRDWGGEYITQAQAELIMDDFHGMLFVVDITEKEGEAFNKARVDAQLHALQPEVLQFLLNEHILAKCQCVALFINKCDVLSGTAAAIEEQAKNHYARLISDLQNYSKNVRFETFVGSASSGQGGHHLFAFFVENILPKNAYDAQLLKRLSDLEAPTNSTRQPQTQSGTTTTKLQKPKVV